METPGYDRDDGVARCAYVWAGLEGGGITLASKASGARNARRYIRGSNGSELSGANGRMRIQLPTSCVNTLMTNSE